MKVEIYEEWDKPYNKYLSRCELSHQLRLKT